MMEIEKARALNMEGLLIASRFTVEEQNLICMYKKDSRLDTMKAMLISKNYIDDEEINRLIDETIYKLMRLKQREYDVAEFTYSDV
mgnify:CR=1 FL=1